MESFFNGLKDRYRLSDPAIIQLKEIFKLIRYKKNEIFGDKQSNNQDTYFVVSGLVRAFLVRGDKTYTAFFSLEDQMVNVFPDHQHLPHTQVSYEAYEDTIIYKVSKKKLDELFQTSLELSNWGRKLLEEKIIDFNNYFFNYFYEEKNVQYKRFLADHPKLIQRVALKDLATYLNVTPQSLSRIRAKC